MCFRFSGHRRSGPGSREVAPPEGRVARLTGRGRPRRRDGTPRDADVEALRKTHRVAVGTFTWRGKTTPIAIRLHQDGLLLQRLYIAGEVQNATEIDQGAKPKIRDQERTLAERLISGLSETEFHPENYEDEYRKRVLKAIEQKMAGQEIQRVEVEARPPTTDLVETLKASLGRKGLAKAAPTKVDQKAAPAKQPTRRRRAS